MAHTKEPWRVSEGQPDNIEGVFYEGCLRDRWTRDPICSEDDARRIVACVNALSGYNPDAVADVVAAAGRVCEAPSIGDYAAVRELYNALTRLRSIDNA